VHSPSIVLADEPTGSLDRTTGHAVLDLLLEEVAREHTTLIIITHDQEIAKRMDRVFVLQDKQLIEHTLD
jgi:ABC-type lipoprotein export system ATPase subunit